MARKATARMMVGLCALAGGLIRANAEGAPLDPQTIPKYEQPLIIPPVMPKTASLQLRGQPPVDYYEITVRQFQQQILPPPMPMTTVWSYGSVNHPGTFNYPAFTIEARAYKPVRIKWINGLVDESGSFLPHLLPVDQTLHWANPPGGESGKDERGFDPAPYTGPVPIVTHVHGAHVGPESDGHPEAWYLPDAVNIPAEYATKGTTYDQFDDSNTDPGTAVFQYPNSQKPATLWYHDHTLGMTRSNVYAGPAGFYLIRGRGDLPGARLPGPAPAPGDPPGMRYYEIPIAIQDRAFNDDGSLFYPGDRAFFEGLRPDQLQIPFIPDEACDGEMSDVSPMWVPEFFGNVIVVNGRTWPFLEVEPRRYRFRLLDGANGRFLLLKLIMGDPADRPGVPALPFWQIGAEGGFLPEPVRLDKLVMGPAERADVIVDFTGLAEGTEIYLINEGPDEPFGGGDPPGDFDAADPETTGQVMKFVVATLQSRDISTPPENLTLPHFTPLGAPDNVRQVTLNEADSETVRVAFEESGITLDCEDGEPFGPALATLGTLNEEGNSISLLWDDEITERPRLNSTEIWEIFNFTADAHPIHLHLVTFQVVNRQALETDDEDEVAVQPAELVGDPIPPDPWETGYKDTVVAYPGQVTRIKAQFDIPGLYVWHCHIVEHEDNEMMREYRVVP